MDREEAIKATRNGAIAACFSGLLTLGVVLVAIWSNSDGALSLWNDTSNFVDVILIFGCAYGVYRKSRFAAVLLFVYFIAAKIFIGLETGKMSGIGIGLVFLYFYGKAIQGAFLFHKLEKTDNPNYKGTPKWVYFTGIPALIIILGFLSLGAMSMTGAIPSTEVQAGEDILESDRVALVDNGIVYNDDKIKFFYSTGFSSILDGGSILTDDRVILYMLDENQEIQVYEIYLHEIKSVELVSLGNLLNNSVYKVDSYRPDAWLQLALSTSNGGDVKFIEKIRSSMNKIKFEPSPKSDI